MPTTVNIDPDAEELLKEEVRKTGNSFSACNNSIRRALGTTGNHQLTITPLFTAPFPPEIANANFNRLAAELDADHTLRKIGLNAS